MSSPSDNSTNATNNSGINTTIDPSDLTYTTASECYETTKRHDEFCITDLHYSNGITLCTARLNGKQCRDCNKFLYTCMDPITAKYQSGYKLHCYNNGTGTSAILETIQLCGDQAVYTFNEGNGYRNHNSNGGYSYSNRRSSRNDGGSSIVVAFVVAIFAGLRCMAIMSRQRQRRRLNDRRRYQQVRGVAAPNPMDVELSAIASQAFAQTAVEVLAHEQGVNAFAFYKPGCVRGQNDPTAQRLKQHVINNDWKGISDEFKAMKTEEDIELHQNTIATTATAGAGDSATSATMARNHATTEHAFYVGIVVDKIAEDWTPRNLETAAASMNPMLQMWVDAEPTSLECRIIRMETFIRWAWEARTAAVAELVSERQGLAFIMRLHHALDDLKVAIDIGHRYHPQVVASQIVIAKGLGQRRYPVDLRATLTNFESNYTDATANANANANNDPWHLFSLYARALQYFCAKWHGSNEQMFALARNATQNVPVGAGHHALWALIPMAHFEGANFGGLGSASHWKTAAVQDELHRAYVQAFPTTQMETHWMYDEASQPAHHAIERCVRTWFLYAMFMTGKHQEECRRQIRLVGKRPTPGAPFYSIGRYRRVVAMMGFEVSDNQVVEAAEEATIV
mmetsp:Transcript_26984/g.75920  ORF Transcript_26984/g.75920 Transcript_26984/m.75920 type:complete len:626 (+) Transcript_26984:184-2061(+)